MSKLSYETVTAQLIADIPELQNACLAELEWLGEGDWVYIIFGLVVNPFLVEALETGTHEPVVRRIFDFVERMARSDDERL